MHAAIKVSTVTASARPVVITHFIKLAYDIVHIARAGVRTLKFSPNKLYRLKRDLGRELRPIIAKRSELPTSLHL